jgi:hypothetical protein
MPSSRRRTIACHRQARRRSRATASGGRKSSSSVLAIRNAHVSFSSPAARGRVSFSAPTVVERQIWTRPTLRPKAPSRTLLSLFPLRQHLSQSKDSCDSDDKAGSLPSFPVEPARTIERRIQSTQQSVRPVAEMATDRGWTRSTDSLPNRKTCTDCETARDSS